MKIHLVFVHQVFESMKKYIKNKEYISEEISSLRKFRESFMNKHMHCSDILENILDYVCHIGEKRFQIIS